jgi:Flp pilus assembly protein TadD
MDERIDRLARRGRKLRSQGEFRKAANAYGELTSVSPEDPRWWVLLAVMLHDARREAESAKALRQALWLFRRAGEMTRYASLTRWIRTHLDLAAAAAHAA